MSTVVLAIAAVQSLVLVADPEPKGGSSLPVKLPHSSIAAVLARRGELGLAPAQVRDLEQRDEALQRERGDIRERFSVPAGDPSGKGPQGQKPKSDAPGDRATRPAEELDDADTRAWLESAAKLPPQLQDKATAVAEKYREELAEQRERSGR